MGYNDLGNQLSVYKRNETFLMIHLTVMMTNNETIDRNETFDSDNDKHLNLYLPLLTALEMLIIGSILIIISLILFSADDYGTAVTILLTFACISAFSGMVSVIVFCFRSTLDILAANGVFWTFLCIVFVLVQTNPINREKIKSMLFYFGISFICAGNLLLMYRKMMTINSVNKYPILLFFGFVFTSCGFCMICMNLNFHAGDSRKAFFGLGLRFIMMTPLGLIHALLYYRYFLNLISEDLDNSDKDLEESSI